MKRRLLIQFTSMLLLFLCIAALPAIAQTGTVKGKVTDVQGVPIIGANVLVVGTTNGTVSDVDGNYTLQVPEGTVELSVSFIGYLSEKLKINMVASGTQTLNVTLIEDMLQLEDVVVIGYGTIKKSDLTGAVASVSSEEITATTNISLGNALQGRAAGVRVTSATGAPGSNPRILIRGVTSINNSSAMWVVDGVPADPSSVNPNDVESIEVLKDAATTAIYGAAGGNGVVIVTTKRGTPGKTRADFNITHGWQTVPESRYIDVATGPEYGRMYTEYQILRRAREYAFPYYDTLPDYNYQDEIFRTAPMKDYYLGVNGGNEQSSFNIGLGYTKQEGVMRNSDYSKLTARLRSEHNLNKWLSVGENISVTHQKWGGFEEWQLLNEYHSPILMALQYQPFVPVYVDTTTGLPADEKNYFTNWTASPIGNISNPVSRIENTFKEREGTGVRASANVVIKPMKGLSFESRITADKSYGNSYNFTPTYDVSGSNRSLVSSISRGYGDYTAWQWQNIATYNNSLFEAHNFTALIGYEAGESWNKDMSATRQDLLSEEPEMWYFDASLNDTLVAQLPNGSGWERAGYGLFGRINYDFKGIFLGQVNYRRDSDSRFGPQNRTGEFFSYSVGLKFTEFTVVQSSLPFLNFGKIRWSSGEIGNNPLNDYSYYSSVSTQQVYDYSFDNSGVNTPGAGRSVFSNPSIRWESVQTQNLGIDLGFLQNKLSFTAEWFKRSNDGMIMRVAIPGHAGWIVRDTYQEGGASDPWANVGKMDNKGVEFQAGWKDSKQKFSYSVNANYTYVTTKAGKLADTIYDGQTSRFSGYMTWTVPNGSLSEFYGYQIDRLFRLEDYDESLGIITNQPYIDDSETGTRVYAQPDAQPGDYKFKDRNGDNKIDANDIGPIGNPVPRHDFGINLNAAYGWFDLNIFIQGATGFQIFNAQRAYQFNTDGSWNWSSEYINDHYREALYNRAGDLVFEANPDGKYPRIDLTNKNGNFTKISDFYLEDGSYVKVKNVQIGLTLPRDFTQKAGIQSLRLYCGAQNLFTFTRYTGYDPEIGAERLTAQGLDNGSYPRPRMYTIGANVKF